jgi:tetratricopeptide (TPR) repeat protein
MTASLACLGWFALLVASPQTSSEKQSPGWARWQQGQAALADGRIDQAIEHFEESLANDPRLARNYLSLAACYLDKGDDVKGCLYLTLYVSAHPEHRAVRLQYAGLLQRLKRYTEARDELESVLSDLQQEAEPADDQLVQCHSRLMQLAEQTQDEYLEHLHRGIGLYLLSRQRPAQEGDDPDLLCPQGLLCKAAAELTLASRAKPDEARPHFYLHQVWSRLSQSHPAGRSLRAAQQAAAFSYLTPAEHQQLQLARHQQDCESHWR